MDKKIKFVLTSMVLLLIIGVVIGFFMKGGMMCTEMGCLCEVDGERPCNGCSSRDPVFILGIINVFKECKAQEIITCQNGLDASTRYDIDYSSCRFVFGY